MISPRSATFAIMIEEFPWQMLSILTSSRILQHYKAHSAHLGSHDKPPWSQAQ